MQLSFVALITTFCCFLRARRSGRQKPVHCRDQSRDPPGLGLSAADFLWPCPWCKTALRELKPTLEVSAEV